jgi:hypothetical protein
MILFVDGEPCWVVQPNVDVVVFLDAALTSGELERFSGARMITLPSRASDGFGQATESLEPRPFGMPSGCGEGIA